MNTPAPDSLARRRFIARLVVVAAGAMLAVARPSFAAPPRKRFRDLRVANEDRAIANLAAEFARADPGATRRIARGVEARLPTSARIGTRRRRVAAARARLLRRDRIDAELATGDVMILDGWVLARSEAEFAVYAFSVTCA